MPTRRKPLIRHPDRKYYSAKDISFSEEHLLLLEQISEGRAPAKRDVILTYEREYDWQVEGELIWKGKLEQSEIDKLMEGGENPSGTIKYIDLLKREPTFVEEVKSITAGLRMDFESGISSKDQSKRELLRFLDSLENTSDTLQEILSEGIVDGRFRVSYAEELLLFGTLTMEDDDKGINPAFIKKLRGDLKSVKELVTRRRAIFEQEKKEKVQADVPDLFRKGRLTDRAAQLVIKDVLGLFENWKIPVTKSELGKEDLALPDDVTEKELALYSKGGEGLNQLKKSDFYMVLYIIFNSAGKSLEYMKWHWEKYKKNPLGNQPK